MNQETLEKVFKPYLMSLEEVQQELKTFANDHNKIQLNNAIDICLSFHAGVKRKEVFGVENDYAIHPMRAALRATTVLPRLDESVYVAILLHDVIEDCSHRTDLTGGIAVEDFLEQNFGAHVVDVVKAVSHGKDINYNDYIDSIFDDCGQDVCIVKSMDFMDNYYSSTEAFRVWTREKGLVLDFDLRKSRWVQRKYAHLKARASVFLQSKLDIVNKTNLIN